MKSDKKYKRILVKIGTGVITSSDNTLDKKKIEGLLSQVVRIMGRGIEILIVTSGAIGAGMGVLKKCTRPQSLPELQACAAIGQNQLMNMYEGYLKSKGYVGAQILLTQDDLTDRKRYLNAKNTIATLIKEGVIPIINENDTVATDEIKFGDNDRLSSLVANLAEADLLVMLSTVEGLCEYDSAKKTPIRCIGIVDKITREIEDLAVNQKSKTGIGGMISKLQAAKITTSSGIPCIVANGNDKDILIKIIDGKRAGTLFLAGREAISARKHWIAYTSRPKGTIKVDNGAREALEKRNKSLLASGITGESGKFDVGDVVSIVDEKDDEFARGLTNFSWMEIRKIKGLKSSEIKEALGYKYYDEIVHRDNLVVL
ncbi:MAG: glutamate 5-kinase [Candidatus Omnitrophota bacterium]